AAHMPPRGALRSQRDRQLNSFVRVRHEGVAVTVLLFAKEVTTPAVLPAVCYRGVRPWQRGGAKPSGQRILTLRGGSRGASRRCDYQHQGGRGPAARGMVNPGEPPPASLQRTGQRCCQAWTKRVSGQVGRLRTPPTQMSSHRRRGGA